MIQAFRALLEEFEAHPPSLDPETLAQLQRTILERIAALEPLAAVEVTSLNNPHDRQTSERTAARQTFASLLDHVDLLGTPQSQ